MIVLALMVILEGNGPCHGSDSFRPLTTEHRLQSQANPCGIKGGQSGSETGFPPRSFLSSVSIIQPMRHTH
jgi:hypothetical protein